MRKLEDDYMWRRNQEQTNTNSLIKKIDLLQIENIDLKRDLDSLRNLLEEKEDIHINQIKQINNLKNQLNERIDGKIFKYKKKLKEILVGNWAFLKKQNLQIKF